jgi:hypothetical protein
MHGSVSKLAVYSSRLIHFTGNPPVIITEPFPIAELIDYLLGGAQPAQGQYDQITSSARS